MEEILKEYFKDNYFEILDGGKSYDSLNNYVAVSLDYITEYVLNNKFKKQDVAKYLIELCNSKFLLPIPCTYADNLVFAKYNYCLNKTFMKYYVEDNIVKSSYGSYRSSYIDNFNNILTNG